jgi:predicted transcriptional regulator
LTLLEYYKLEKLSLYAKIFFNPTRISIINLILEKGPLTIIDISKQLDLNIKSLNNDIRILSRNQIIYTAYIQNTHSKLVSLNINKIDKIKKICNLL